MLVARPISMFWKYLPPLKSTITSGVPTLNVEAYDIELRSGSPDETRPRLHRLVLISIKIELPTG